MTVVENRGTVLFTHPVQFRLKRGVIGGMPCLAPVLDLIENDVDVIRAIHSKRQPVDELERMLATETPDELEAILNS